jgi:pimeloyl-ACP methyl ester carboxylesterase
LNPANATQGFVKSFVQRFYGSQTNMANSVWMFEGGPGDSANKLSGFAEYMLKRQPSVVVYCFNQRGTGASSPLECSGQTQVALVPFDPSNSTKLMQSEKCNTEIVTKFSRLMPYYTTYHSAVDLKTVLDLINPEKVSFYALSYGTYFMNTYLQLSGARHPDALILDGPVPANRWVLTNNAEWVSKVSQDVINLCAQQSELCKQAVGEMGMTPRFTMDAIIDGTLPCLEKLPWLTQHVAALYTAFLTLRQSWHVVLAPFWARLHRCSEADVAQLNFFHTLQQQTSGVGASLINYGYGVSINIGASELYSFAPPDQQLTYQEQVNRTGQLFGTASPELILSYAIENGFPRYTPNPAYYKKFAQLQQPTKILVGTLDPNTPHGLGVWLQNAYGNNNAELITVPYSAHGTVNPEDPCVLNFVTDWLCSFDQQPLNKSCLAHIPAPDFSGAAATTKAVAKSLFGSGSLWDTSVSSAPTPVPTPASSDSPPHSQYRDWSPGATAGLAVGMTAVGIVLGSGLTTLAANRRAAAKQEHSTLELSKHLLN